jgi:hypothetical protein
LQRLLGEYGEELADDAETLKTAPFDRSGTPPGT